MAPDSKLDRYFWKPAMLKISQNNQEKIYVGLYYGIFYFIKKSQGRYSAVSLWRDTLASVTATLINFFSFHKKKTCVKNLISPRTAGFLQTILLF